MTQLDLSYLKTWASQIDIGALEKTLYRRNLALTEASSVEFWHAFLNLPEIQAKHKDYSGDLVEIGDPDELTQEQFAQIEHTLRLLMPWRKGPFRIFGVEIDSEWRSDLKWNRLLPHLEPLGGRKVADVGCGNGYFMFRMAEHNPEFVLGLDPTRKFKLAFTLLNRFAGQNNLHMELLGFEHLRHFNTFFDTLFCMGILYHHTDPMEILRLCHSAMRKGGQLVLETMGVAGDEPVALFPQKRYANMRNVWFVPTAKTVAHMLERAGFGEIRCFYNQKLNTSEQRRTVWADTESLADFLSKDQETTLEGYPAPSRIYFTANKLNR